MKETQQVIELSEVAWREYGQMGTNDAPVTSLARQEASEFLREFRDGRRPLLRPE